jgi:DNA-binding MarR family transcriptional regulator
MSSEAPAGAEENEHPRIMLGLLESVARDGMRSQRHLASELGIALGLVNAYIKRCVKKGLLKVSHAPAGRYAYYLTPRGFSEKSRLTVEYLSYSFSFFRRAKAECTVLVERARVQGLNDIVLAGCPDLAEIAAICAMESGIRIVGVVDPRSASSRFLSFDVASSFDRIGAEFDAVMITDLTAAADTAADAVARFGADRVLIPDLLRLDVLNTAEEP